MSPKFMEPHGRIGLFGGTFDPPHWGHIRTASSAADELRLDQVAFIPAPHPPHKQGQIHTPYEIRRQMVASCLPLDSRFRLCLVEEKEDLPGTTLQTVRKLRQLGFTEDRCHLVWLTGSDSLLELGSWYRPEELLDSIEVAVMPRPGFPLEQAEDRFLKKVRLLNTPLIEFTSSEIRARRQNLEESVPKAVAEIISKHGLYKLTK